MLIFYKNHIKKSVNQENNVNTVDYTQPNKTFLSKLTDNIRLRLSNQAGY